MGTLDVICRQILDLDPALRCEAIADRLPSAKVTPLASGCILSLRVKGPEEAVERDFTVEFDRASLVVSATWRQMFNDINSAFDVFCELDRMARKRLLVVPRIFSSIGTRRSGAQLSHSWGMSSHQSVDLYMEQPVPRARGREVILRHRLKQPHAMIAAAPALWSG